jgi:ATP synthase A1 C subunit
MSDVLGEGRVKELVDLKNKDEVLSSLMDTIYKEKLTKVPSATAREVEMALNEELIDQYLMVIGSTGGKIRDLFVELFRRFEVENLKAVIIAKASGAVTEKPLFFPVEDFFGRRISSLMEADSLEGVISRLEEPYKSVLEAVLPEYEESNKVLLLETALYNEIYGAVWERIERLGAEDSEIVKKIVGTEFDIVNLMTMLRFIAAGANGGEMVNYFLPYFYAFDFTAAKAKASLYAEDVDKAIQLLPSSEYKDAFLGELPAYEEEQSLIPFERVLRKLFYHTIKNTLKGYPVNIGTIIGFLYLKEIEIKNLGTITVCKENKLSAEETMKVIMV